MRSEDCDWTVYHIITGRKGCQVEDICEDSGFSPDTVHESLGRLISTMLIIRRGALYRACSFEEFMITNRMKHDPTSDIIIENGVIRVKDPGIAAPDTRNTPEKK